MPKSVRFFKNTCPHCKREVGIPSLGSFAYGEFIYQTEDGRSYAYVSASGNPAWRRIDSIFKDVDWKSSDQDYRSRIFQKVLILCADPHEGKRFTTRFPLCSKCGEKIRGGNDDEPLFDEEIPDATWDEFLSTSDADQRAKVLSLIDKLGAGTERR